MSRLPGWLLSEPIAHRGLHDAAAGVIENSLPAFAQAADAGMPVELDVQLSADDVPMVFHDMQLDRLTPAKGAVLAQKSQDLQRLQLHGTGETIPSLAQVLARLAGRVPMVFDIKGLKDPVGICEAAMLQLLSNYPGAFTIQSFRPERLDWLRHHAPAVVRGQLACDFERPDRVGFLTAPRRAMLKRLMFNYLSRPDYISYDIADLPYRPVTDERRRGLPVIGYTAHSQAELARVQPYIDNIIFEGFRPS